VITAGGGGVSVVQSNNWLHGLEAVVDKDYAPSLLARTLEAYALLILTDVPYVYIDYGKPGQKPLELTASEARRLLSRGTVSTGQHGS